MDFRVLIVSDVRLLREGIALGLRQHGGFESFWEASVRHQVAVFRDTDALDVALVDMTMPEAFATVVDIRRRWCSVPVIALGVVERENEVVGCAEAGVAGYVSRESSISDLVETMG